MKNAETSRFRKALTESDSGRCIQRITDKQRHLTEKHLLPYQEELLKALTEVREKVDSILLERLAAEQADPELAPPHNEDPLREDYPIGCCHQIRNAVFKTIYDPDDPTAQPVREILAPFVLNGGVLKQFYGIWQDQAFQNALQAGSLCLDIAYNTHPHLPAESPSVKIGSLPGYIRNITSFEDYYQITEKAWNWRIYPNRYFPLAAPWMPAIILHPTGVILLAEAQTPLYPRNVLQNFHLAEDFITKSKFSDRTLPKVYQAMLKKRISDQDASAGIATCFAEGVDNQEIHNIFDQIRAQASLEADEELCQTITTQHVPFVEDTFREAGLWPGKEAVEILREQEILPVIS